MRTTAGRARGRLPWAAAATFLLSGCAGGLAGWNRVPPPLPAAFETRQQVQVWQGSRNTIWHGVQIRADTISGIPYHRPLESDSSRRHLPLATVDSVRLGSLQRVGALVAASPWLIAAALLVYFRLAWGGI